MAMNALAMKAAQYNDQGTSSGYESESSVSYSSKRRPSSRRRKQYDPDVTEITVNIDAKEAVRELSARFNLEQLRAESFEPVNIASLVKGYHDPKGRRLAPRHDVQLTVVLYTSSKSFRTTTQNISAGGAMLRDELPQSFGSDQFDILFIYEDPAAQKKRYFMMKGQAVGSSAAAIQIQATNRVQFKGANPSTKESFHKFVEELAGA